MRETDLPNASLAVRVCTWMINLTGIALLIWIVTTRGCTQ